ncbi:MAG: hypothetical protein GY873_13475, partial [Bosea sp.]|uniref:hypothetical protein n=1 Tax=Bosea sp. (in: a-proteobacteria) TaxID=1871050 RepID=UPI00239542AD|nr:hypothetical protein [Bosea sp. (in: a-proteobacteria)]
MSEKPEGIPPTEPEVIVAAADTKPKKRGRPRKARSTVIDGASLVPNLDAHGGAVSTEYCYWCGVIPDFPGSSITLAGLSFAKVNHLLIPEPGSASRSRGHPVPGALVWVSRGRFELLVDSIKRTVVRFFEEQERPDYIPDGTIADIKVKPPRRTQLIKIQSADHAKSMRRAGLPHKAYVQGKHDEPIANWIFCILCENQDKPVRGASY